MIRNYDDPVLPFYVILTLLFNLLVRTVRSTSVVVIAYDYLDPRGAGTTWGTGMSVRGDGTFSLGGLTQGHGDAMMVEGGFPLSMIKGCLVSPGGFDE